ncbi:argininosuccinate lyase [Desulfurella multipotens]|uniref:Argininosuccinate lyase n=2 Tax=Desulfurella TaxID=33001 RepID=A0A1G6PIE6_9BACT|nr:argininosuccinate lyase [Desulfurella multipotens]SDC79751.1 argininosuccinate lyase [Desulfurella multipotens]
MNGKLWAGRFNTGQDNLMEQFSESISYDKRLYKYDILGSIAHVKMLAKQSIILQEEAEKIIDGLRKIERQIEAGEFEFNPQDEDIHMAIERALINLIGKVGGKLHTARSRNDQIALDERLFLRDISIEIIDRLNGLLKNLALFAKEHIDVIIPGFTHMQHAQPILFSHYIMAFFEKFKRDKERFLDTIKRIDVMPLGAGALAGTIWPIDRRYTASLLNFTQISKNSIDAVSDRDFMIEFLNNCAIFSMHASRLAEDFIIYSSSEFSFIELPDEFSTGSSIMPQKKNPDSLELIRGKTGRVYGNLFTLLTVMKGLPLSYNRDMQEDKEALFDTIDNCLMIIDILSKLIPKIKLNIDEIEKSLEKGFITATDLADYLAFKGYAFRDAHKIVGSIVAYAITKNKTLKELTLEEYKQFADQIEEDVYDYIDYRRSVDKRKSFGGTSRANVLEQIEEALKSFDEKSSHVDLCPRCSYPIKIYKNPSLTVDCIIEKDNKVLLINRKNYPFGFALPGGFVNYGESVEQAVIREVKEETSLDIVEPKLFGVYSDPERDPRSHTVSVVFYAKASGTPKASDDAEDLGFFDLDNLPEHIVFDHLKILKDYYEFRKKI